MSTHKSHIALLLLATLLATSVEGARKVRLSGIFSDLRYVEEAGDLLGYEVWIVPSNEGYFAVVQIAEGYPAPPEVVLVTVKGNQLEFALENGLRFQGTIDQSGLRGTFHSQSLGHQKVFLKRGKSYWQ